MAKQKPRDTYKYTLARAGRRIRSGITNDLDRREREHQRDLGSDVRIRQVGRRTNRDAAREWEKDQRDS